MNTNLSSFTDGFSSSDFDENIPYKNKMQQRIDSSNLNELKDKECQQNNEINIRQMTDQQHFLDKSGNPIFDLSEIDLKTDTKSQIKNEYKDYLRSKEKSNRDSKLKNKNKNQAFNYAKRGISQNKKEEREEHISQLNSSHMSIPEENYDYQVEEIEIADDQSSYFNPSNFERENLNKDKLAKNNKTSTKVNSSSRNQILSKLNSRVSPLRSYEAFADGKNIL